VKIEGGKIGLYLAPDEAFGREMAICVPFISKALSSAFKPRYI
jgi:hypothetical protein